MHNKYFKTILQLVFGLVTLGPLFWVRSVWKPSSDPCGPDLARFRWRINSENFVQKPLIAGQIPCLRSKELLKQLHVESSEVK